MRSFLDKEGAMHYLHISRAVSAGFNGGDGAKAFAEELSKKAFPSPPPIEKPKQSEPYNWVKEMLKRSGNS